MVDDDTLRRMRGNKRSWGEEDVMTDHLPDANKNTKKARKEFRNQYFVGGMRNPAISVKRLGLVKEAGQDILRLWNAFLKENPVALDAARSYGTERCCLDDRAAKEWSLQLGRLLKVEVEPAVKLKGKFGFQTPLNAPMWRAWQKYARDPDEHLHIWAVSGAPLGMDAEILDSGGVFPPVAEESEQAQLAPELEVQLGMGNYKSMQDDADGARQELDRLVSKGFAAYLTKNEAREHFHRAMLSRLAFIAKVKDSGAKKFRIIIDLLRPGGNERVPRISDVAG